jgi:ubiquinone/menaquinone biosynthesis C-methylase UbiE
MPEPTDIDLWNAAAAQYEEDTHGGRHGWRQERIISPALFRLLGAVTGQDILDAGCGPGWLSVLLAQRGARVTGVDGAEQMLVRAQQRAAAVSPSIAFVQADLCAALPLPSGSFDGIVSNMVLMDIPDIATAFAEFRRLLRPGGRLVLSITHPLSLWRWTRDDSGRKLYKAVDDYLTVRPSMEDLWGPTRYYHRPLSWYVEALASAGFVLDSLVEPTPEGMVRDTNTDYLWRVPDYSMMRALPRPAGCAFAPVV